MTINIGHVMLINFLLTKDWRTVMGVIGGWFARNKHGTENSLGTRQIHGGMLWNIYTGIFFVYLFFIRLGVGMTCAKVTQEKWFVKITEKLYINSVFSKHA